MKLQRLTAVFLALGVCAACARSHKACDDNDVACVGGYHLTRGDVEHEVIEARKHGTLPSAVASLTEEGRRTALDHVIEVAALARQAEQKGLPGDPEVQAELARVRREALARIFLHRAVGDRSTDEAQLRLFYDQHPECFRTPAEVSIRQIVVGSREKATELRGKVMAGASFEDVASAENIDASRRLKGNIGWIRRGTMDPDFESVAFALHPGELSAPIQTRFGWHVLRAEARRGDQLPSFAEARHRVAEEVEKSSIANAAAEARSNWPAITTPAAAEWIEHGGTLQASNAAMRSR